jgi:hypothetical protein
MTDPTDYIEDAGASTEQESERNGFASYAAEVHAIGHGLYDGMRDWRARPGDPPDNEDVQAEPHYYKGAYVVGTLLQALIAVAAATVAF